MSHLFSIDGWYFFSYQTFDIFKQIINLPQNILLSEESRPTTVRIVSYKFRRYKPSIDFDKL